MRPDPDRTPEPRIYYCFFCGEEINGPVEIVDGHFADEGCKWEVEKMQLNQI